MPEILVKTDVKKESKSYINVYHYINSYKLIQRFYGI